MVDDVLKLAIMSSIVLGIVEVSRSSSSSLLLSQHALAAMDKQLKEERDSWQTDRQTDGRTEGRRMSVRRQSEYVMASGVLLKMEVGIRKGAWRRAWRYPANLWSLRWVYTVRKTPEVGIRRIPAYTPQYTTGYGVLRCARWRSRCCRNRTFTPTDNSSSNTIFH